MPVDLVCGATGAELTTLSVGGQIEHLYLPHSIDDLADVWARLNTESRRPFLIGAGSNLLISDEGITSPVVSTRRLVKVRFEDDTVEAEAGLGLQRLVKMCAERGLSGLEGLVGIPASVGGAVAMNAGGKWGCIGDVVESAEFLLPSGEVFRRNRCEMRFSYRRGPQKEGEVITRIWLRLKRADAGRVWAKMRAILRKKVAKQPLSARSAGCVFKNPDGFSAGYLIERVGMKGMRSGGAVVSRQHANFILNRGGAKCADVLTLMREIVRRVEECFGVKLEPEVIKIGG